jgi:hypothetical protein
MTWEFAREMGQIESAWSNLRLVKQLTREQILSNERHAFPRMVAKHPDITFDDLTKLYSERYNKLTILHLYTRNPNASWEFISKFPGALKDSWILSSMSKAKCVTWEIIKANPDFPWKFGALVSKPKHHLGESGRVDRFPTAEWCLRLLFFLPGRKT